MMKIMKMFSKKKKLKMRERENRLSDLARPLNPQSRHVREGTFGQTNGLHHLVERRKENTKKKKESRSKMYN
jgi:hypothetical protein